MVRYLREDNPFQEFPEFDLSTGNHDLIFLGPVQTATLTKYAGRCSDCPRTYWEYADPARLSTAFAYSPKIVSQHVWAE